MPHSILQVGQPIYSIYVVRQIGILSQEDITKKVALYGSQTVGDPRYFDANGDGKIDANDRVIAGHPTPDYTWVLPTPSATKALTLRCWCKASGAGLSILYSAAHLTAQARVHQTIRR